MPETYFNYFNGAFDNTFGTETFLNKIKKLLLNEPPLAGSKAELDIFLRKQPPNDRRVIVEYEEDREKNREIKAIYVRGFRILWEETHWAAHEAKYLKALTCDLQDLEKLHLTESPFQYLKKLHRDLRFLLFIDLRLFDFCLESWPHYNDREPECVAKYFTTLAEKVCKFLATPKEHRKALTLEFILELHEALTKNLGSFNAGKIRNSYNACPMGITNTSKEGIKELLLRIKTDKNKDGFRIGKLPQFSTAGSIGAQFAFEMWNVMMEKQAEVGFQAFSVLGFAEEFSKFKQTALNKTCQNIQENYPDVSKEIIEKIIQDFLEKYKGTIDNQVDHENNSCNWFSLREFFYGLTRIKTDFLPMEFDYRMQYARQHAYAHVGGENLATDISQYSDEELDKLAQTILKKINQGEAIYILPPRYELIKQLAETAIANFNATIQKSATDEEVIVAVDALTHELEILHIFIDGNCRTNYVLQNLLLMANQVKWSVLYDPLRIGTYSKDERIKEIKQGIFSYRFILDNEAALLDKNQRIQELYKNANANNGWMAPEEGKNAINDINDYYKKISQIFNETLEKYCSLEREEIYQHARGKVSPATIPEVESTAVLEQALQSCNLGNN